MAVNYNFINTLSLKDNFFNVYFDISAYTANFWENLKALPSLSRTQKVRGPRWGQGILRRRRMTKAYQRKNYKFKGPLPPGLEK